MQEMEVDTQFLWGLSRMFVTDHIFQLLQSLKLRSKDEYYTQGFDR